MEQAQKYLAEGHRWVVDLDLEKFFDRVNHDKLRGKIAQRVSDKPLLKLIRAFLTADVMEDGLVSPVDEGTPQGGPLSPLLSNLVLDEWDRELERRGVRFARYGWLGYFGRCQTPSVLRRLDEWTRRRPRSAIWKQWKRSRVRFAELRRRGGGIELTAQTVGSSHGPWRLANSPALALTLSNAYFNSFGIPSLTGGR